MRNSFVYKIVFLTIFSVLMSVVSVAYAQSGSITFLRYSYVSTTDEGDVLRAHFEVRTHGLKGEKINIVIYLQHPRGTGVPDLNGRYKTYTGFVSASNMSSSISYDNAYWKDYTVDLPYSEMHPLSGTRTYDLLAILWYNGEELDRTYCDSFSYHKPVAQRKTVDLLVGNYDYTYFEFHSDGSVIRGRYDNTSYGTYYVDEYSIVRFTWDNGYQERGKLSYDYYGKAILDYDGYRLYEE